MDEITINLEDTPLISQPSPVLVGQDSPVLVQENFVGGRSATIQIGSVETLPFGSEAYVDNVGTETDAIFNFGIPEGQRGEQGDAGRDGVDGQAATIQIGTVSTGLPDSDVTFENVGTPTNAIFDISIPRGVQGETGETGATGADGISPIAYVTQLSNGATIHIEDSENTTDATVYNGTDGTDGSDGFSPIATVTQNTGSATISITDLNGTTTATVYDGSDAPVPNDGTLTIQKNGTTVQTFTANQSSNATANITVPTATSELTNDSGYITNANIPTKTSDLTNDGDDGTHPFLATDDVATVATSGSYNDLSNKPTIPAAQVNSDWNAASGVAEILNKPSLATVATSGSYNDLSNKPTIPTKTSELTNDSSFVVAKNYAFTATTDGNGFAVVPNSVVKPTTGYIIGARCKNRLVFTTVCNDTQSSGRYTIQCDAWDHSHISNTSMNLEILYVLIA